MEFANNDEHSARLEATSTLDLMLTDLTHRTAADCVLVGELDTEAWVHVRRMRLGETFSSDARYPLAGTPCQDVFECSIKVVPTDVARLYPDDDMLRDLAMQGYVGVPLTGQRDSVEGILVLLFAQPLAEQDPVVVAVEEAAGRIGFELERLRYDARLRRSERRYRSLVEQSSDGILVHRDFRLLYANPEAARMFGHESVDALLALDSVLDLLPDDERQRLLQLAQMHAEGVEVPREHDLMARHKDGHALGLHAAISEVDWDGQPAYQLVLNDITVRRESEARAQQARRLESIGKLTGGIAHDFNNLLAIILGNLELLEEGLSDPEDRRLLADAVFAAEQGANLTRRLLSFARKQPLQPRRVDVAGLLEAVRGLLRRTLTAEITLEIVDRSNAFIEVDPTQMQAALLNLAINARDALEGPGILTIDAWKPGREWLRSRVPDAAVDWVCIEVSDNGRGMPASVRERAFEPFFTTKASTQGTGLGLSMVHGFVRQSAGEVEIDSIEGRGTQVRIYLPEAAQRVDLAEPEQARSDADHRLPSTRKPRILVVEDEPAVRRVAQEMLRSFGFDVVAVADGAGAREQLGRQAFELLLTDVVLPGGINGPQVAQIACELHANLPVLFMTGYADIDAFEQFEGLSGSAVLQKPFRRDELRRQVTACLQGSPN